MADAPPNPDPRFPNRRPATAVVGGQRRRGRRPPGGVPRASATPTFDSILGTATAAAAGTHQQPAVATRDTRHLEASRSPSMNFYPPVSGIPADYRPATAPGPVASTDSDALVTPTSTASTSTAEGKKQQSMFSSFKGHGHERPSAPQAMLMPTSPLPPDTPGKAARMLGLPEGIATVNEPLGSHGYGDDQDDDEVTELDIEPDPPKSKKFSWGKAGKMFDTLTSSIKPRSQTEPRNELTAASSSWYQFKNDTNDVFSDDPIPTEPPRPAPEAPSRRSRRNKKSRKDVEQMSPIDETSHDELRSPYQQSASVPDLGVIPEYRGLSKPMPLLPHREAQRPGDELDDFNLSPSDNFTSASGLIGGPSTRNRGGIPMDQIGRSQRAVIPVRGPLQTLENRYLEFTEETLEEYKKAAAEWEAARQQTDEEVRALKVSHEEMKKEFAAMLKARDQEGEGEGDEEEDDDDLVSLRSSIDLSEEPTLHTAIAMPILRVTPGMVKLVDIPARKK